MLFNSHIFIFLFLPITLSVFFKIGKMGYSHLAIAWLAGASLFFYGWWNPAYLILIIGSVLFNYMIGVLLGRKQETGNRKQETGNRKQETGNRKQETGIIWLLE